MATSAQSFLWFAACLATCGPAAAPVDPETQAFTSARRGTFESARWHTDFDFVDRFEEAELSGEPLPLVETEGIGGKAMAAIFHHPRLNATDLPVTMQFRDVKLPEVSGDERLVFHFYIGIREGFDRADLPQFDGCTFHIALDGEEVFSRSWAEQAWEEWAIDLTSRGGRRVSFMFRVEPNANSAADWAVWGRPRLVIEGRKAVPRPGPQIPELRVDSLLAGVEADRIVAQHDDGTAHTIVAVLDERLDLPVEVARFEAETGPAPVPLAPPMVAGEGAYPDNHTVVRVLNAYGIAEAQFLAYPESVRGGVLVGAGRFRDGIRIVAAPLTAAEPREVRIFSVHGALLRAFAPAEEVTAPFRVECGDYLPDRPGDEIAVVARHVAPGAAPVVICDGEGAELARVSLPIERAGEVTLTQDVLFLEAEGRAYRIDAAAGQAVLAADGLEGSSGAFPSAFGGLIAAKRDAERSLLVPAADPKAEPIDIARYERTFWYQWYPDAPLEEGRWVRGSRYNHFRTDAASPAFSKPRFDSEDPEDWIGGAFRETVERHVASYAELPPQVWNVCFAYRAHRDPFEPWAQVRDPESGLHKYVMLTRNNNPASYGEFGTVGFHTATFALGVPELNRLYIWPLRAMLRSLAEPFRASPEHFVALEPNHEHEIAVGAEGTNGDYHPRMISGFFGHLVRCYGSDRGAIEEALRIELGEYFDAPRNWDRGSWDDYSVENPFYREWIAYNRYVVNRRIAQSFREALLAGFPPEAIKSHQIPDSYAIGGLGAFSDVVNRYTPIDYALTAGVGFGFTRYGVWYEAEHNVMQGAHSSGFDLVCIGEYQALTDDPEPALAQLRYIHEHGGASVHCMRWPSGHDQGYNAAMDAALRRFIAEDPPRPGIAGGVGQVRAADGFDVASLGVTEGHTGLLKSLRADGSWAGTVYVVPFHAHVAVDQVALTRANADGAWRTEPVDGLDSGQQIEATWRGRSRSGSGSVQVRVERNGVVLPGLTAEAALTDAWKDYRFVLRVQLPIDGLAIAIVPVGDDAEIAEAGARRHADQAVNLTQGRLDGVRHRGGVTFDLLPSAG